MPTLAEEEVIPQGVMQKWRCAVETSGIWRSPSFVSFARNVSGFRRKLGICFLVDSR